MSKRQAELLERLGRCDDCGRYVPDDELIYLRERDELLCTDCCLGTPRHGSPT
jgi:hypothetical protein